MHTYYQVVGKYGNNGNKFEKQKCTKLDLKALVAVKCVHEVKLQLKDFKLLSTPPVFTVSLL